jgi:hypothetical protein
VVWLSLQLLPETLIWSKMYISLHVKHPSFLSDSNLKLKFHGRFSKNAQISSFVKIPSSWDPSCTLRTDRQDRRDEANIRYSQFCERAQKKYINKYKYPSTPRIRKYKKSNIQNINQNAINAAL